VIAESAIDTVFNTDVVAELAKLAKVPAGSDHVRFGQNIRIAVKSYFAEQARHDRRKIHRTRGRPRDPAARELVQNLALAYLEATGQRPPRRVRAGMTPEQPFLKFVRGCFDLAGITSGNIDSLINEREARRLLMELPEADDLPVSIEETGNAFEKRFGWREPRRKAADDKKRQVANAKAARAAQRKARVRR
jgi:hypothetical protein